MSERLAGFLKELPSRGVPENAVDIYRRLLEVFESQLPPGPWGKAELDRFLSDRQRAGASPKQLRNIETACRAYLEWCGNQEESLELDFTAIAPTSQLTPAVVPTAPAVLPARPSPPIPTAIPTLKPTPKPLSARPGGTPYPQPAPVGQLVPTVQPQRMGLVFGSMVGLLVLLGGGCLYDHVDKIRRVKKFSSALLAEARRANSPADEATLRRHVFDVARAHHMKVSEQTVSVDIAEMTPPKMAELPQSERMVIMDAMQRNAMKSMYHSGNPKDNDTTFYFVEVIVGGETKGLFGKKKFEFVHHLAVGGELNASRAALSGP